MLHSTVTVSLLLNASGDQFCDTCKNSASSLWHTEAYLIQQDLVCKGNLLDGLIFHPLRFLLIEMLHDVLGVDYTAEVYNKVAIFRKTLLCNVHSGQYHSGQAPTSIGPRRPIEACYDLSVTMIQYFVNSGQQAQKPQSTVSVHRPQEASISKCCLMHNFRDYMS